MAYRPREYVKWRHVGRQSYIGENTSNMTPTTANGVTHELVTGLQYIKSEGHPYYLLGKSRLDLGGNLDIVKIDSQGSLTPRWLRSPGGLVPPWSNEYYTILVPSSAVSSVLTGMRNQSSAALANSYILPRIPSHPSETTMMGVGAQMINNLNPTNSVADLAISMAEFFSERKLFSLPTKAGSLAGEYLNYMFGIAPTIGLVKDLRSAISDREKVTQQYVRDSGKWVRRQSEWEPTRSTVKTVSSTYPATFGPSISTSVAKPGQLTTITREYQKWSFSGAFTYYLPPEGIGRDVELLDKLYGVKPGASSTAWELMPFSWIADYKVSLGASIQNVEAFAEHHIVMPYAYVMCHSKREVEYTWVGSTRSPSGMWVDTMLHNTVITESKQRRAANPFGFGISPQALSPKQWSILAALGLSLASRK